MSTPTPLRILHLYPKSDYFTGAAIQLRELALGLQRRGHHVVVGTRPSEVWAEKAGHDRLLHRAVPMSSSVDFRSVRELVRIVKAHGIDVVHAHKGTGRDLALVASLLVPIPVIVLNRGVTFPVDRLTALLYRTRRLSGIVAVCRAIKDRLIASGVPAAKIAVIYSGTDTERFHPKVDGQGVRKSLGLAEHHSLVVQIGVRSWKGNDDVLDAMAIVTQHAPDARLLIVGARQRATLQEKARARGIGALVHVEGYREDIPEILAAADVCVDASYAGLGLTGTLREALAVETPVVATGIEGNPELVIDGDTGLLVPPRDPAALARAILRLIADPAAALGMAQRGRRRVEAMFSLDVKVRQTEALYTRLLAERTG